MVNLKCKKHHLNSLPKSLGITDEREYELRLFIASILNDVKSNVKKSIVFENCSLFANNNEEFSYLIFMFGVHNSFYEEQRKLITNE